MLRNFCRRIGLLRCSLALITLLVISAAPFADGGTHLHDWRLFPNVIAPTVMLLLVFALALDMTMARIFMIDATDDEHGRLRTVIWFEFLQLVVMLSAWSPILFKQLNIPAIN